MMDTLSQHHPPPVTAAAAGAQGAAYTNRVPAEHALEKPATQTLSQSLRARRRTSSSSSSLSSLKKKTSSPSLAIDTTTGTGTSTRSGSRAPRKSAPNYVRSQAASPELISSLIDQLSAISQSTERHFNSSLPAPAPASEPVGTSLSSAPSSRASLSGRYGSVVDDRSSYHNTSDRSPYYSAIRDQNDLFPDDACEPPVIRTSKPPSGLSPITAPPRSRKDNRKDKTHALASYVGRSAGSSASIHSCHSHRSHRSSNSFGNISIEAGPIASKPITLNPAGGSSRSSAESKRSVKRPRSLMYMSSRERLKQKETDSRKRRDDAVSPDSPRKPASQLFSYEDTIKEEPLTRDEHDSYVIAESSTTSVPRKTSRNSSPARRIRLNLVDGPSGESPIEQGLVPDRGSSLRHSSPKKSRKSSKSKGKAREMERPHTIAVSVPEESPAPEVDPEEARKQKLLLELEQEENEVAQRIKQLREQKLLRDRMAGKLPADDAARVGSAVRPDAARTGTVGKPDVSGLPSPDDSPASPVSHPSEERTRDSMKARKLLGISTLPATRPTPDVDMNKPLPSIESHQPREPTRPPPLPPHLRHARHRSLTVNDGDDIPLPINYALALKTLDKSAPNSPRTPRVDSTQLHLPSPTSADAASAKSSTDGIKRSSSLSMGGRPMFGRKANSMIVGGSTGHKHSASLTEERPPTVRSVSEEVSTGRHSSLSMASASNSFSLQQKKALKKKRWSHPDLPAKAEKAHNAKVDAAEAEAKAQERASHYPMNPWSPVIEERPTSLDSIDMDVDAYLHAPRLSQKIRHPQTGRIISFSEVGDPNGYAVFVCVGMGLTRFVMAFYDQLAATLKLRLITPERPGVAGSQVDPNGTPLTWPDDVLIICQALKITKFSLLAHSAGAIYALATALRMPQHIRGRVHLLAPWIPPSQMAPIGIGRDSPPTQQLPRSQRFLRALPPSLLRVANSTFLSNQSASLHGPTKAPKQKRKPTTQPSSRTSSPAPRPLLKDNRRESMLLMAQVLPSASTLTLTSTNPHDPATEKHNLHRLSSAAERARASAYDERLTFAIWARATASANPATDLIVCLETKQPIGFRYEDINRPVVIHHGSKDSRVPVDNVRWVGKVMRRCEVRVLEGEGHGLMASAGVMGGVLSEISGEWGEWEKVVRQASVGDLRGAAARKSSYA